jgi:hypothetical protein
MRGINKCRYFSDMRYVQQNRIETGRHSCHSSLMRWILRNVILMMYME